MASPDATSADNADRDSRAFGPQRPRRFIQPALVAPLMVKAAASSARASAIERPSPLVVTAQSDTPAVRLRSLMQSLRNRDS